MAYLVMARRWRPLIFEEVVAQEHVTVTLMNAIRGGKVAHAYLFSGPRGVGKTTTARILAKALNCQHGPTPIPCNQCSPCREITEGRSLDVLEIDGASNRGIDEVRELRENVKYTPLGGRYKVYIIDEVHMLTDAAFNALLKTLEEPPSHVIFVLATTTPHKVPATILSRCQRFDFRRIPLGKITEKLSSICEQEGIHIVPEALELLAVKADGSMRDAESLLDQVVSFTGGEASIEAVRQILGLVDTELFFELTEMIRERNVQGGMALVKRVFDEGYDVQEFLLGLADHFRHLLLVRVAPGSSELIPASEAYRHRYGELASEFSEEDLLRMIKVVSDTEYALRSSFQPQLHLEVAITQLIKLESSVLLDDLLRKLAGLEKRMVGGAKGPSVREVGDLFQGEPAQELEPTPTGSEELTLDRVREQWNRVIELVGKRSVTLGTFLTEGTPTDLNGDTLVVTFARDNGFHADKIDRNRKVVEEVLRQLFQRELKLECVVDPSRTSGKGKENESIGRTEGQVGGKDHEQNPLVKLVLEAFDGELIED